MFSVEVIIFFLSSALTLLLTYLKVPTIILQQITSVTLILLLILSRVMLTSSRYSSVKSVRYFFIFTSAFMVQILVLSTGGLYSPFLILLHLFILGTSFLLNLQASISFLIFSAIILVTSLRIDAKLIPIFQDDPGSAILYLLSFLVIVPLAQLLMRNYQLKDTITKILSQHIQAGESRERSILDNLSEIVIITDSDLRIISVNYAFERSLNRSSFEVIGKHIFDAIKIQDQFGTVANTQNLSIDKVLNNKVTHIIGGFYLITPRGQLKEISIQITPVIFSESHINQIVFVIADARSGAVNLSKHLDLERAMQRHKALGENLKKLVAEAPIQLRTQAQLFSKTEEDLITALELEDHSIIKTVSFEDVAQLCQRIVNSKLIFAQTLNVALKFQLPEKEAPERSLLYLKQMKMSTALLPQSVFGVPVDTKWLEIIIQKLLDLVILLSSGTKKPEVVLSVSQTAQVVEVLISSDYPPLGEKQLQELFIHYYGFLGNTTNLRLGSGLEGFIAKTAADELNLKLNASCTQNPSRLVLSLELSKNPSK